MTKPLPGPSDSPFIRRLLISLWDLNSAASFASVLVHLGRRSLSEGQLTDLHRETALTAMIVTYARPFSGNKSDRLCAGRLRLESVVKLTPVQAALHDRIISLRNSAFAHGDPDQWVVTHRAQPDGSLLPVVKDPRVPMRRAEYAAIRDLASLICTGISGHLGALGIRGYALERA
ncbi:MAG: hypothetical protein IT357_15510 [Gemmatimonadaceae bacterium]|nr:hypothetical protein [Gemmatimonadaceae bacterium]